MTIREEFRAYLRESKEELHESVIDVVADMAKQLGFKKDDIHHTTNPQKKFEKVSLYSDDISKLEKAGNAIKKATDDKLNYMIIHTEDNYGNETKALYVSNIKNDLIDKKRIIKEL